MPTGSPVRSGGLALLRPAIAKAEPLGNPAAARQQRHTEKPNDPAQQPRGSVSYELLDRYMPLRSAAAACQRTEPQIEFRIAWRVMWRFQTQKRTIRCATMHPRRAQATKAKNAKNAVKNAVLATIHSELSEYPGRDSNPRPPV